MIHQSIKAAKAIVNMPNNVQHSKRDLLALLKKMDNQLLINAKILSQLNRTKTDEILQNIQSAEFQVYSQWGDDGIIQFLVEYLEIENKTFIEFGVENYTEANTRFLMVNNNWKGLIMDGSKANIDEVKYEDLYWRYDLTCLPVFINRENINGLIEGNGFTGDVGLLHIDLDGNDYWIWKEINCISPTIVIMEYNSVFGIDKPWTVKYDEAFVRTKYHHSNLYFGSSLLSLCDLAKEKGYTFIGCNSHGNNAYFVQTGKLKGLRPIEPEQGFVTSKFRESRNKNGELTFISGSDRIKELKGMEIFNTRTGAVEVI